MPRSLIRNVSAPARRRAMTYLSHPRMMNEEIKPRRIPNIRALGQAIRVEGLEKKRLHTN